MDISFSKKLILVRPVDATQQKWRPAAFEQPHLVITRFHGLVDDSQGLQIVQIAEDPHVFDPAPLELAGNALVAGLVPGLSQASPSYLQVLVQGPGPEPSRSPTASSRGPKSFSATGEHSGHVQLLLRVVKYSTCAPAKI